MPLPDALAAAEAFRADLLARERATASRLVRAYGSVYQRLQGQIDALAAEVEAIKANGGTITLAKAGRLARLRALREQIASEMDRYGAYASEEVRQSARDLLARAGIEARALTQAALPGLGQVDAALMASWQALNPDAVESLMGFLSPGSPLWENLTSKLGAALADKVADSLVRGIALGWNPRKVAAEFRREMGQGLNWSLTTARTAQLYAYREGTRASYAANSRIVPRWIWRSARDSRTCASCLAMDGTVHPVTEPLNDHHCGRCVMIPQPITYRDLGLDVDAPPIGPEQATGEEWFKAQPRARQVEILGPGKHDAWLRKQFTFSQLSTVYTDPVYGQMRREATLAEII